MHSAHKVRENLKQLTAHHVKVCRVGFHDTSKHDAMAQAPGNKSTGKSFSRITEH